MCNVYRQTRTKSQARVCIVYSGTHEDQVSPLRMDVPVEQHCGRHTRAKSQLMYAFRLEGSLEAREISCSLHGRIEA